MKTPNAMLSLLLLSAVCVTPAHANWFSNSQTGTMRNIGSAPNPTPADLRALRDADKAPVIRRTNVSNLGYVPKPVAYELPKKSAHAAPQASLTRLEGKTVYGAHGARLGSILAVNLKSRMAELQAPSGIAVAMPASWLVDKGQRVVAPSISPLDVMAMAKSQTGRTVAINVDHRTLRSRSTRG